MHERELQEASGGTTRRSVSPGPSSPRLLSERVNNHANLGRKGAAWKKQKPADRSAGFVVGRDGLCVNQGVAQAPEVLAEMPRRLATHSLL